MTEPDVAPHRCVRNPVCPRRGAWLLVGLLSGLLSAAPRPAAAKIIYTTCQDICSTYTSTLCIVTAAKDITPGSDVDCTDARDIQVNGGELRVHDGRFTVRGKSLTLDNGGKLVADCPQSFDGIGYRVEVLNGISIAASSASKMTARCGEHGGAIALHAGTSVTIDGLGIDANGSATDAAGGSVAIEAGTTVSILAPVSADGFGGVAEGGTITIDAADIAVQAEVRAKGYGANGEEADGGEIRLSATGDVEISSGYGLNAESDLGSGGEVAIDAGDTVSIGKPIRVEGTGSAFGTGGGIELIGNHIVVDDDLIAPGGKKGGTIRLTAGGNAIAVGAGSHGATLDATGSNGGAGGTIAVVARGSAVTVGSNGTLTANTSTGAGGLVHVEGTDVTTTSGAHLSANGATGNGGTIEIEARGAMALAGQYQASNGSLKFVYRTGTPSIAGSITGYELSQDSTLAAPCGDGVRLVGVEACDGGDIAGETCTSQGHGTGTLSCSPNCTFSYAGCSN